MSGLTPEKWAELRAMAEAATPGPWSAATTGVRGGDHWYVVDADESIAHISANDGINEEQRQPDAEFIAAWNPETAKDLLDALDERDAEVTHWKAHAEEAGAGFSRVCKDFARVSARNVALTAERDAVLAEVVALRKRLGAVEVSHTRAIAAKSREIASLTKLLNETERGAWGADPTDVITPLSDVQDDGGADTHDEAVCRSTGHRASDLGHVSGDGERG